MVTARMLFEGIFGKRAPAGWRRTTVPWRLALHAGRRLGWGVADQAVSSITNFAVNIYIARDLGAVQYGAFALAYVTYGFALNASRGLATDPLLVRFSGADLQVWRRAVMNCTGTALLVGLVTGACVLLAARPLGGGAEAAFLALGLTLPGLLLQDSWRFAFFALGRGSRALINDVIWAMLLLPALVLLRWSGHADVFWFVLAWGAAGSVAAAIGPLQAGLVPRLSGARAWLSRQRDLGARYTAEGTANSVAAQLRTYSLGIILGLAALGYVQAASTLMGPMQILIYGMGLVALPEAARILRRSPQRMPLFCGLISAGLALLGLGWGIVLMVALPRGLGHWLLGSLWRPAYPLILPTTLYFAGMCVAVGGGIWLHALAAARRSLRAAVINAAAIIVFSVLGAIVQGTAGSVRGAAVGTWTGAFFCWWQLRAALKETTGAPEADPLQPGRRAEKEQLRIGVGTEPRASGLPRRDVPWSARIKSGDHPFLWAALSGGPRRVRGRPGIGPVGGTVTEQAFDLPKVVRMVRRNKLLIGAFAAAALLGGAGFAVVSHQTFTSTAQVVLPGAVQSAQAALGGFGGAGTSTGTGDYMATQVVVAGSDPVLSLALSHVRTATSLQSLRNEIKISSPTIGIVSISAQGRSAAEAEGTANAVAQSYVRYVGSSASLVGRTSAHVINSATAATASPLVRRAAFDGLVSGLGGALIGILAALVISRGSRRLRECDEIANSLGLPVFAALPVDHPADAAGWTRLLDDYQPPAVHAWQLRTALRKLGMLRPADSNGRKGIDSSLTVVSLSSDDGSYALGPQLAVFAASLGIPTALVVGARQNTAALATLRMACAAPRSASSRRPRMLHVVDGDSEDGRGQPEVALTVVVAVIDDDASKFPDTARTAMTVLGVSAGATTADQLARVAVTAAADGREVAGFIVADPEPTDRTTGHIPQVIKVSKLQTAGAAGRAGSDVRPRNGTQVMSE